MTKLAAATTAVIVAISVATACSAAGGRFVPRLFGWMMHVMAFGSADPNVIWGGGSEHDHMHQ